MKKAKAKIPVLKDYKWVDLKYTDLMGNFHHVTLPSENFEDAVRHGVGFDSSSCAGFKSLEGGDMVLIPDQDSAFEDPFSSDRTLSFFCNIYEADTKKEYARDPRNIAQRAHKYLQKSGIADNVLFGPEFEFYVFDRVIVENKENISGVRIESYEGNFGADSEPVNESGEFIPGKSGYHAHGPNDKFQELRNEMSETISNLGIKLIYHHHEVGPGQNEIEIKRYPITLTGDYTQLIKRIIKYTAYQNDLSATFMPKPLYNMPGTGMHFHQHLFKGKKNLFFDDKNYGGLSKLAEYYVSGLLKHGRALLAFTNPSTNSYKRLIPGFEAPVKLFYSLANRSSAVRIPKYATSKEEKRIEFRPPDATSNPYIACSAMLMAGLDGIKKKIDPKKNGFGPYDMNMETASEDIINSITSCPASLQEALEALKEDHDFLLEGGVFTKDTIDAFIKYKEKEIKDVQQRPHPFEFELYF